LHRSTGECGQLSSLIFQNQRELSGFLGLTADLQRFATQKAWNEPRMTQRGAAATEILTADDADNADGKRTTGNKAERAELAEFQ
jgi:hypothetical protein